MKKFLLFLLVLPSLVQAAKFENTPSVNFGGGLNIKTSASEIEDTESPDMSNMVNDIYGASSKRNGSNRFISQAISSGAVSSLFKGYALSSTTVRSAVLMSCLGKIYMATSSVSPSWITVSSGMSSGQGYEYLIADNRILITGDRLEDEIKTLNIINNSTATRFLVYASSSENFRAKHLAFYKNYLVAANILELTNGTTYYPSRLRFSSVLDISSFSAANYLDISDDDGKTITKVWVQNGSLMVGKESSITEISAEILDADLTIGDQTIKPLVNGFGVIASKTLATDGRVSIFLSGDGIRLFNNGVDNRDYGAQSKIISTKIQPIIEDILRDKTYNQCSAVYYKNKSWYVFSYVDRNKFPSDRPNSILVYDLISDSWFPLEGWHAASLAVANGPEDSGNLLYGQSYDSYVFLADVENRKNDAGKELLIDTMDNQTSWNRSIQEVVNVKEGSGSLKLMLPSSVATSSMSIMGVYNLGEWVDKKRITDDDLFSMQVYVTSPSNISSIRIDLEVSNTAGADFDNNFTSVTITSASLTVGPTSWTDISFSLSSFTLLDVWISTTDPEFPFSDTLTFFGVRLVVQGIDHSTVAFDNLRVKQFRGENPIYAYRYTKQFNFGAPGLKHYKEVILNVDQPPNSTFSIDSFKNFGEYNKTEVRNNNYDNTIYVSRYNGAENISKLDSIEFKTQESTHSGSREFWSIRPIVVDGTSIYGGDQFNERILVFDRSNITNNVFVSSFGSLGSGTTNFNGIFQIAQDADNIYVCDFFNHRVKAHSKKDGTFIIAYSSGLRCPTGVGVDSSYVYTADEGGATVNIYNKESGSLFSTFRFNLNCVGGASLYVDSENLYLTYKRISESSINHYDLILEKRKKTPNYDLLISKKVRPIGISEASLSTSTTLGDISGVGDFLYVPFTRDANTVTDNYIQKIFTKDLSIVSELSLNNYFSAVYHPSQSSDPARKQLRSSIGLVGQYLQMKYYVDGLDNGMKIFNHAFSLQKLEDL